MGKHVNLKFRRFVHEGTRRRSFFSPMDQEWKDATYLSILDTDWLMRSYSAPAPNSLWEELFARHHREREELLRWDERRQGLNRTSSMETLRVPTPLPDMGSDASVPESEAEESVNADGKGKRKLEFTDGVDTASSSEGESDYEDPPYKQRKLIMKGATRGLSLHGFHHSPTLSEKSLASFPPDSGDEYDSSSSSQWDILEMSPEEDFSDFDLV